MVPNGLMVRTDLNQYKLGSSVARLYTRENGVHLDEAGIELITADCEQNPGAVLVLDAFLSLIGPLGLDADSDAAVEPLQNLLESIALYDISTVVCTTAPNHEHTNVPPMQHQIEVLAV